MTLLYESQLFRLWTLLCQLYGESGLRRLIDGFGHWCVIQWKDSVLLRPFRRQGNRDLWRESRFCRLLTAGIALPGDLLHRWYTAWQNTFEDSFFARLAFSFGEGTAVAESWLIMVMWMIPFLYWDNAYSLTAFAAVLVLFHAGAMRRRDFRLDAGDLGFWPVLFFCIIVISAPLSWRPDLSWRFLGYHAAAALCVLVTVSAVHRVEDLKRLCVGAGVVAAVSSAYAVIQRIRGVKVNLSYVDLKLNPDMPGRVTSYFDNPNTFAEVLVMLLPLVLALFLSSRRKSGKALALGVWLLGVAALLMTYSRAAWVGFALSVGLTALLWAPGVIPALIALCIVAIPFLPSAVWTRILTITNFNDTTTSSRFPLYDAAFRLIQRRPLTGAGLGTDAVKRFIAVNRLYRGSAPFVHAHNLYLEVWIETGLLGLASLLGALGWNIKEGVRAVQDGPRTAGRAITCAAVSGLAGISLCAMGDYPWHYPRVMVIFWFLFAMVAAGVKVCRTEAEENRSPVPEPDRAVYAGVRNPNSRKSGRRKKRH